MGAKRGADKSWLPYSKPAEVRQSVENNLKEPKLEQLALVHFGMAVNSPAYKESFATMLELQREGKILHVGLTNATVTQFATASKLGKVASVENLYSYAQRLTDPHNPFGMQGGELLAVCEEHQIPFVPYFSLQTSLPTEQHKL